MRPFHRSCYKVLNAPKLKDDFYTNLLDWSREDMIGVVLDNAVYVWAAKGNEAEKVLEGYVSSVKWGRGLVIGEESGRIRLVDVEKRKETHRSKHHLGRQSPCIRFEGHQQEICGLKWSTDNGLLASGGNDNLVLVWEPRMGRHIGRLAEHTAAVKALAWSPHRSSELATGGGSTDKSIKIWSTSDMKCLRSTDSGSQVCNMLFSTSTNELVSTHGYSLNSVMVWNPRNLQRLATLEGHSYRVLYLAKSPDEESILTGSGDQTLRFWKLFPSSKNDV
ncbi:unnamed protein product [Sphagnum balticum]